ncbi:DUF951 domain-containing protein [Xylocopilactobacillus apicola]|uniref:DUF951 domain-containing protein n=1 Tax=Xylocopilactobacillus apicola TaxID=2932184 RepID=A0AAU9DKC8_9LACO|nr:DUF951 domain-containing protein [Xylocopilactobacillus apicola]BDR58996.1 hypothetical protein XA3_14370 [Xylocopilactobacillus apicola]
MEIWLNDQVVMKKPHACGKNHWQIVRVGADIGIICLACQHKIVLPRADFLKKCKKIEHTPESTDGSGRVIIDRLGDK